MDALIERCCGLDVHQGSIVACIAIGAADRKPHKEVRRFGTMRRDLEALRDWLAENGVTHVAMESTGVYWLPVYDVLEGHFELTVGNAQHMKRVPGRKTDMQDSDWITELQRHGLIAKSFVPPREIRGLRELMRHRRSLVQARSTLRNQVLKLLESVGLKLASVMSDVFGVSGQFILRGLAAGDATPEQLAGRARGRLRRKQAELAAALDGVLHDHHRLILRQQLDRLDHLDGDIAEIEQAVEALLAGYREEMELLQTVPGCSWTTAATVISEIGVDMSAFASAEHLSAWAGLAPGNRQSGAKRLPAGKRKGNVFLQSVLITAAHAAARQRASYLQAKYHRLKARRGPQCAAVAIARHMLVAIYHMLKKRESYRDLGPRYLDQIDRHRTARSLVRRLNDLGYKVDLTKLAA